MSAFTELKDSIAAEKAQSIERLQALADRIAALEGQTLTATQIEELKADISNVIPDVTP